MALRSLTVALSLMVPVGAAAVLWPVVAVAADAATPAAKHVSITHELSKARSGHYQMDHDHARLFWSLSHQGYSTFMAQLASLHGTLDFDAAHPTQSQLDAIVDMNSVATLIPAFDKELQGEQYFNTAKYPTAEFKSTHITATGPNQLRVAGTLTFLGVTKPVVLQARFNQAGEGLGPPGYRVGFDGHLSFKRSDFGMSKSAIGDNVTLAIEAEFKPDKTAG